MYRVMIADDEGIVIESLRMMIERSFGDSCIVESARTGRSVIELAEKFRPDIAFMDIQMPGINGIDAIAEIQKTNPTTEFVIISAYDKFDYAKKAMKLGVMEYIMKPFNTEKIVKCLESAMGRVDDERNKRAVDLRNKEKLETVIPIIENTFLCSILFEEDQYDISSIGTYKELLGMEAECAYMLMIEYGDSMEQGNLTNPIGVSVKAQGFYQELREIAKEFFPCIIGPVMANRVIILIPCDRPAAEYDEYNERIKAIERARDMLRKLRRRIDVWFRIGIGSVQPFENIRTSYTEARIAMKSTKCSVAHFKDVTHAPLAAGYSDEGEKRLMALVRGGNNLGVKEEGAQLAAQLFEDYGGHLENIKGKLLELIFLAQREGSDKKAGELMEGTDCYGEVALLQNEPEIKQWFVDKLSLICVSRKSRLTENSGGIIQEARAYISGHYHKNLSLEDVSRIINLSPYYFSKLFKEETGTTFVEYVTGLRISKAKELLENNQMSMKEICIETGYGDPNYFSRIFKKTVGITPTEYREKLLG